MKTYREIIDALKREEFPKETMEKFSEVTEEIMEEYEEKHEDKYKHYLKKMNEIIFPKKMLEEDKAKKYVDKLKKDKSINHLFTLTQVEKIIKDEELLKECDLYFTYFTLNFVYYIFYDTNFSMKSYIKLAHKLMKHNKYNPDIIEAIYDMLDE
ncbi:MAG: hypothetical protein NC222_06165 [Staphylococcus sp.]|nr:hypothetical protein [Staphylococcus sp.]